MQAGQLSLQSRENWQQIGKQVFQLVTAGRLLRLPGSDAGIIKR